MRRYEREHGPGGEVWWAMNRELADSFGLFGGMTVYEDPTWESSRPIQSALQRFHELERASKAAKEPKFKYKWQK
jgi:hypothetical protein